MKTLKLKKLEGERLLWANLISCGILFTGIMIVITSLQAIVGIGFIAVGLYVLNHNGVFK